MKGNFQIYDDLTKVREMLLGKKPFSVLCVSTSGMDNDTYNEHEPIYVLAKEFEYDEGTQGYEESLAFDQMRQCSDKNMEILKNPKNRYNAFASAGIDRDTYLSGNGVLSQDDFKEQFTQYMKAMKDNGAFIVVPQLSHAETYLKKIGCTDILDELKEDNRLIDNQSFAATYFEEMGRNDYTLGAIRNFCDGKDLNAQKPTIKGADMRLNICKDLIVHYGREKQVLTDRRSYESNKRELAMHDYYVDKGRKEYEDSDFKKKLDTLIEKKVLVPNEITKRDGNCELNRFYDIVEKKNGNKGITILTVATTGLTAGDVPMQCTLQPYNILDDGSLKPVRGKAIVFDIQADAHCVQKAIDISKQKNGFDAFKYAGIDLAEYQKGVGVHSIEEATEEIKNYFNRYNFADYPVVTNGSRNGRSYAGNALSKITTHSVTSCKYIDFTQVLKEYCYAVCADRDKYGKNVVIPDESKWGNKTFSLDAFIEPHGITEIKNTSERCSATGYLASLISIQHAQLLEQNKDKEEVKEEVKEETAEQTEPAKKKDIVYDTAMLLDGEDIELSLPEFEEGLKDMDDMSLKALVEIINDKKFTDKAEPHIKAAFEKAIDDGDTMDIKQAVFDILFVSGFTTYLKDNDIENSIFYKGEGYYEVISDEKTSPEKEEVKNEPETEEIEETEDTEEITETEEEQTAETEEKEEVVETETEPTEEIKEEEPEKQEEIPVITEPEEEVKSANLDTAVLLASIDKLIGVVKEQSESLRVQNEIIRNQTFVIMDTVSKQAELIDKAVTKSGVTLDAEDRKLMNEYLETVKSSVNLLAKRDPKQR